MTEQGRRGELNAVVAENIRTIMAARARYEQQKSAAQRVADVITGFAGTMTFVVLHVVLFGGWILLNAGIVHGIKPWDPFPFVMLAMWASVEAIFISTFVLMSQNRMSELADQRADLDLQVNLLAEHELTKVLGIIDAIARKVGVETPEMRAIDTYKEQLAPEAVLDAIQQTPEAVPHPETTAPVGRREGASSTASTMRRANDSSPRR